MSFSFFCKRYAIVDLHPYGSHKGKSNCVIFMGRNGRSRKEQEKTTQPFIHSFSSFSLPKMGVWVYERKWKNWSVVAWSRFWPLCLKTSLIWKKRRRAFLLSELNQILRTFNGSTHLVLHIVNGICLTSRSWAWHLTKYGLFCLDFTSSKTRWVGPICWLLHWN